MTIATAVPQSANPTRPSLPPTTVVNKSRGAAYDVYIGRPSCWGNPFVIGRDGDRAAVIAQYERWIATQPHLLARLGELRGKRLACFCAPQACHGHVLARLADALPAL